MEDDKSTTERLLGEERTAEKLQDTLIRGFSAMAGMTAFLLVTADGEGGMAVRRALYERWRSKMVLGCEAEMSKHQQDLKAEPLLGMLFGMKPAHLPAIERTLVNSIEEVSKIIREMLDLGEE